MKRRNPFVVFLLALITFGIYQLYWLADTRDGLVKATRVKVPTILLLFSPLVILFLLAIVMGVISTALGGNDPGSAGEYVANVFSALTGLLAVLAIVPITLYWYWKFAKAIDAYTHGHMGTVSTLLLLWLLGVIGMAIIQDSLNSATDAAAPYGQATPPSPPMQGMGMQQPSAPTPEPGYQVPMQPLASQQPPIYPQPGVPQVDAYGNPVQPPQYPPVGPPQA